MDDTHANERPGSAEPRRRRRAPNASPATTGSIGASLVPKNSEVVYRDLRARIVDMSLLPGHPISELDLAREYQVSRTPVREALQRLSDERLVEVVPKSGTFVARIPLSFLPEALVARRALEQATVQAAAAVATPEQVDALRAILTQQSAAVAAADEQAFHRTDEAFHLGIANVAGYPVIWDLIQQVKVHVDRYRRLTLPQPGRMNVVVQEHLAIVAAIAAHDGDAAGRRMSEHLDKLQLDIAIFSKMWPDYFIEDAPPTRHP